MIQSCLSEIVARELMSPKMFLTINCWDLYIKYINTFNLYIYMNLFTSRIIFIKFPAMFIEGLAVNLSEKSYYIFVDGFKTSSYLLD